MIGSSRALVEDRVAGRAAHTSAESVKDTCSFARAERLLGREYHGRFLIELLQNAADAWRRTAAPGTRSELRIVVDRVGPALVVANCGVEFPAEVVLDSLGQIGSSTKPAGEAIGHKGIGFKSVLEVSHAPELYSGFAGSDPTLSVRFDAHAAQRLIQANSPDWDRFLQEVADIHHPIEAIPILRYPMWVEDPPAIVRELAAEGFTTVVRLPFTRETEDLQDWLNMVRTSIAEVSDQILLLLGTFNRMVVDDRLAGGGPATIVPQLSALRDLPNGVREERVDVLLDGAVRSRWWLYRREIPGESGLASETAVGIRVQASDQEGMLVVVPPLPEAASAPFHLFFPTQISSGLPLLLHGYFEVNAARTGFYQGSATQNARVLDTLADLVAQAVSAVAESGLIDLASLVNRVASATPPDDESAQRFRRAVLDRLDDVAWVPVQNPDGTGRPSRAEPRRLLLSADEDLDQHIASTFGPAYVQRRTGLELADPALGSDARALLRSRRPDGPDVWALLGLLLRPGQDRAWLPGQEEAGFRCLLDLVRAVDGRDHGRAESLFDSLRGDEATRLLPVVDAAGATALLPFPDPAEAGAGRPSTLVMGRVRSAGSARLAPPEAMKVAFLPDGLLASEPDVDRARPLGVRPFNVDSVLDRLNALEGLPKDPEVVTFLWSLLARERSSEFGAAAGVRLAATFDPGAWLWCQPGRGEAGEGDRARQRRERLLSTIQLPARDGTWRAAGTLAFGADWADWIEATFTPPDAAMRSRMVSYRALEDVAPDPGTLLASPTALIELLPDLSPGSWPAHELSEGQPSSSSTQGAVGTPDGGDPDESGFDEAWHDRARHAFLLRLGVWEVIPVLGHSTQVATEKPVRPWADLRQRLAPGLDAERWNFAAHRWSGRRHHRVNISEDFALAWPVVAEDPVRRRAVNRALAAGGSLYARLGWTLAFCPGCGDNGTSHVLRYRTGPQDRRVSTLHLQLRTEPWLATTVAGVPNPEGIDPGRAWFVERPPSAAGMSNSPMRFLALSEPDVAASPELRQMLELTDLVHAPAHRVESLLLNLRKRTEAGELPGSGSSGSRQALIGLHRLAYERLAELGEPGVEILGRAGVLCERRGDLEFRPPIEARHDDGRNSTYRRHFAAVVPFVVLARDKGQVAKALRLLPFEVDLVRRGDDPGQDVTADLADALTNRIPELLAILVHHSLGAQTLEPASDEFQRRFQRLQALRVRRVPDLVLDLTTDALETSVTLGEGSTQDVFLQGPTTAAPVLYHDLDGDDWAARLRPRLAAPLAALVENPAYAATFQLLLLAESDSERENVLHELGISIEDVTELRASLGALTDREQATYRRWYAALIAARSDTDPDPQGVDLSQEALAKALSAAGYPEEASAELIRAGGGDGVRRQEAGILRIPLEAGVALDRLDGLLRGMGDQGLEITAARDALRVWREHHARRVAVVLSPHLGESRAKDAPRSWKPPDDLRFVLDPLLDRVLDPVVASLRQAGLDPDVAELVDHPTGELARLAGVPDVATLDARVRGLYDEEERRQWLAHQARMWHKQLVPILVLARSLRGETRAGIRGHAQAILETMPPGPAAPSALAAPLSALLPRHPDLGHALRALLDDSVTAAPPDQDRIRGLAEAHGLDVGLLPHIKDVLTEPPRALVQDIRDRSAKLAAAQIAPQVPPGLVAPPPPPPAPIRTPSGPCRPRRRDPGPAQARPRSRGGGLGDQFGDHPAGGT